MSVNRKRGGRKQGRLVHTRGRRHERRELPDQSPRLVRTRQEREADKAAAMFREGQGRRRPPRMPMSAAWNSHTVEQTPGVHGTRHDSRLRSDAWGGHYLRCKAWHPRSFMRGKGLTRKHGVWALYVQDPHAESGRVVGFTDDAQYALGWKRAAEEHGWECRMHSTD